jgi:hypothetical protein
MTEVAGYDWADMWRVACGLPEPGAEPAALLTPADPTPALPLPTDKPPKVISPPATSPRAKCTAHSSRTGEPCKQWPVKGATVCKWHGGGAPQVRAAAERRLQEQQAAEVARRGVAGLDLSEFADPYNALEFAVSYSHALRSRRQAEPCHAGRVHLPGLRRRCARRPERFPQHRRPRPGCVGCGATVTRPCPRPSRARAGRGSQHHRQ